MQSAIAWLIALLIIGAMFWMLVRDNSARRNRTNEEYERDLANSRDSMLRAGLLELDRFYGESRQKRAAVEYLKDDEQGTTKTGGKDDDADRTTGGQ